MIILKSSLKSDNKLFLPRIYFLLFIFFIQFWGPGCGGTVVLKKNPAIKKISKSQKLFHEMYQKLLPLEPLNKNDLHILRVLYVEDPSLPVLTASQKRALLLETRRLTKQLLGFRIAFKVIGTENIGDFFKRMKPSFINPKFQHPLRSWMISLGESKKIRFAIHRAIGKYSEKTLIRYFGQPPTGSVMVDHIYRTFMVRIRQIYEERDLKGRPLFNKKRAPWMSFAYWDVIAYNLRRADFVITNSLIAGPDTGMPIYVINRGGVTSAFVENNLFNRYQAAGIFATYQYLSNGKYFKSARGELPKKFLITAMAHLFVHELGHFLRRFPEQYNVVGSVHVAPVDLNYYKWFRGINPAIHPVPAGKIKALKKY